MSAALPVELRLSDQIFRGWQRVAVRRGMDQVAGGFELTLTERWSDSKTRRPIRQGEASSVRLGETTVVTGHIDVVSPSYDSSSHTITVSGRDATGDLVDCAVLPAGKRWKNQTLSQIARDICKPFGISVLLQADEGAPLRDISAEPGERAFEVLERAARYRGLLLLSDGLGSLVIARPGNTVAPTALRLGENILSASGSGSFLERFGEYLVLAQLAREDSASAEQAAGALGRAVDSVVRRYRPTIIVAEDQADAAGCAARAQYQRSVNAGRGNEITYTVNGWQHSAGLWTPNTLVSVEDAYMGINDRWLITRTNQVLDDRGARTELTVMPPSAYDIRAVPEPQQETNK